MDATSQNTTTNPLDETVQSRFLRYVRVNTQSNPDSNTFPSTECQFDLLRMLSEELKAMGLKDVEMDKHGYVRATIPATSSKRVPAIGFIAHVDTSPDVSGKNVNPQIVKYNGGDIIVNRDMDIVIEGSSLQDYKGHTLVTTDGTTLLGADDKAGVAEIMAAAAYLISHPEIEHGVIRIAFTPDEEIGRGADHFDVGKFGAKYAYTIDGGSEGSLEYETFNAAGATIEIEGFNTHPGYAFGKMINAQTVAMEIDRSLPENQRPENTKEREGFFHLTEMCGDVEKCTMHYIIRDHDKALFEQKKEFMRSTVDKINSRYDGEPVKLEIRDQYYNMREKIEPHVQIVNVAMEAMRMAGVKPAIDAVRGGTDGSRLSFMGLPCPNIFSGAENMHSRKEFVSVEVMGKAVQVIVNIASIFCNNILEN